jgi:hypothetical protein
MPVAWLMPVTATPTLPAAGTRIAIRRIAPPLRPQAGGLCYTPGAVGCQQPYRNPPDCAY